MRSGMTGLEVTVLGRTGVAVDGRAVALRPREAAVAAALALAAGPIAADDLVDLLWREPPRSATKSLHNHVARLRRAAPVVVTEHGGYRLDPDVALDRDRFEQLVARTDPDPGRAEELAALLERWQGPAYAALDAHPTVDAERTRLAELRLTLFPYTTLFRSNRKSVV